MEHEILSQRGHDYKHCGAPAALVAVLCRGWRWSGQCGPQYTGAGARQQV